MAVIRCSLKDGRFAVEEVLEFERGDTIQLDESDAKAQFKPDACFIIPCPPEGDCVANRGVILKKLAVGSIVAMPPKAIVAKTH